MFVGGRAAAPHAHRLLVLNPKLASAIQNLQLSEAEELIVAGADVNLTIDRDLYALYQSVGTALALAATQGNADAVRRLLQAGANVDQRSEDGTTPLMCAAAFPHPGPAQSLLSAGADANARDRNGDTPLIYATRGFELNAVTIRALLKAGADPNARGWEDETALSLVEQRGAPAAITALRSVGAKGLRDDLVGVSGAELFYAVRTQDTRTTKRLIRSGASVAVLDGQGRTPLMYAADQYDGRLIRYLLQHARDVRDSLEIQDKEGNTALARAISFEYSFGLLLKAGASPYATYHGGDLERMTLGAQRKLVREARVAYGPRRRDGAAEQTPVTRAR